MNKNEKKNAGKRIIIPSFLILFAAVLAFFAVRFFCPDLFSGLENTLGSTAQVTLPEFGSESAPDFSVTYIDVGQGDCIFISCEGKTMLIDAGENGNEQRVINELRSRKSGKLDYVVCSHPHSDHIGSLPEVIREFGAETFLMPKLPQKLIPTGSTFSDLLDAAEEKCGKMKYALPGDEYALGSAKITVIAPLENEAEDLNDVSLILRLEYGKRSFLFVGDAEKAEERSVLDSGIAIDSDILKVGHHGSSDSSSAEFLDAVSPKICVISCGRDNDYGHPHQKLLDRLAEYTDRVYRTDLCGTIELRCENENIIILKDK